MMNKLAAEESSRTPVLERLRNETRTVHEQLEAELDLTSDGMTVAEYRRVLERFFGFYEPFEKRMGAGLAEWQDFLAKRRKAPWLEKDLAFLGSETQSLPRSREFPQVASTTDLLGTFYVMEGATLGGQLIARHVEKRFGLEESRGCRFFKGYGSEHGAMWRSFRALVTQHSSVENDKAMVAKAKEMFASMHRWLCRTSP